MENEQVSALTTLLNFCRRALRSEQIDVKEWRRLRGRVNKAFGTAGPPRIKADYGLISDLKKGVPVKKVAERYKVSRGTVYRMIEDHPELAKLWEEKRKKKPDPAPAPVSDPLPVQPTQPPLPDVLLQFLASHRPKTASPMPPVGLQRVVVRVLLSNLGLVRDDEYDTVTDEELAARVTAYQCKDESQPDKARQDAVEPSPPPPPEAERGGPRIRVSVRGVDDCLTRDEAAKVIATEITQNLEPFAEMDPAHEFFGELPKLADQVTGALLLSGSHLISDSDIPEIAKWAVAKTKSKISFPPDVLVFAGLTPQGAGHPGDEATTGRSAGDILRELLAKHRPKMASEESGSVPSVPS